MKKKIERMKKMETTARRKKMGLMTAIVEERTKDRRNWNDQWPRRQNYLNHCFFHPRHQ